MKYLLDVNVLLASIWDIHLHHHKAFAWLDGKQIVICPLAELGFIRISTRKSVYNYSMEHARESLGIFIVERQVERIADDLPALNSHPRTSDAVTDHYLADLAAKNGIKLATFDAGIKHPFVLVIN